MQKNKLERETCKSDLDRIGRWGDVVVPDIREKLIEQLASGAGTMPARYMFELYENSLEEMSTEKRGREPENFVQNIIYGFVTNYNKSREIH